MKAWPASFVFFAILPLSGFQNDVVVDVPASQNETVLDVPYVHQEKNGCGSASLTMIVRYWRPNAPNDAREAQQQLYLPEQHGIPASSMQRYLETRGFFAFAFAGKWLDLTE